jgi:hypothetical protein
MQAIPSPSATNAARRAAAWALPPLSAATRTVAAWPMPSGTMKVMLA